MEWKKLTYSGLINYLIQQNIERAMILQLIGTRALPESTKIDYEKQAKEYDSRIEEILKEMDSRKMRGYVN